MAALLRQMWGLLMAVIYIVDGLAVLVIAVAVVRVMVRRHRSHETDDWSEDQEPNIVGNIAGQTRR